MKKLHFLLALWVLFSSLILISSCEKTNKSNDLSTEETDPKIPEPKPEGDLNNIGEDIISDNWLYKDATFNHYVPLEVNQGESFRVNAQLTLSELNDFLEEDTTLLSNTQEKPVKITNIVEIRLSADEEVFAIRSITENKQLIDLALNTNKQWNWAWEVTPLASGYQELEIVAYAQVKDQTISSIIYGPEINEIDVKSNLLYIISEFIKAYWEFLATAIFIPLIVWGYNIYKNIRQKRKENKQKELIKNGQRDDHNISNSAQASQTSQEPRRS